MRNEDLKPGFYWVRINGRAELTVGLYSGEVHSDGSSNTLPWEVVASDEIFSHNVIEAIAPISKPTEVRS